MDAHGVFLPRLRNSLRSDSPRLSRNTPHASGKRLRSSTPMKRYGASGLSPDHVAAVDLELRSLGVVPGGDNHGRSVVLGRHVSDNGGYAVLSPTSHIRPGPAVDLMDEAVSRRAAQLAHRQEAPSKRRLPKWAGAVIDDVRPEHLPRLLLPQFDLILREKTYAGRVKAAT